MAPWHKILKNTFKTLVATGALLFFIHIVFQFIARAYPLFGESWIFKFFDFGLEGNLPTFFSGFLFILLSISAWFCGVSDKYRGVERKDWLPWMLVSALLLFLSIDEVGEIHEQLTDPMRELIGAGGFLFFAWIIPYALALFLLSMYFLPFISGLSKKTKLLFFIGAGVFILGAIGFEMLGAKLYESGAQAEASYAVVSSLEELFEFIGLFTVLKGLFGDIFLFIISIMAYRRTRDLRVLVVSMAFFFFAVKEFLFLFKNFFPVMDKVLPKIRNISVARS